MKFFQDINPSEFSNKELTDKIIHLEKLVEALLEYIQNRDKVHLRFMYVQDGKETKITLNVYNEDISTYSGMDK